MNRDVFNSHYLPSISPLSSYSQSPRYDLNGLKTKIHREPRLAATGTNPQAPNQRGVLAAASPEHFFLVAFCFVINEMLFCGSRRKCTEWEGTGTLSILLPSCVSLFFAFAEPHDEPARTVRDRSTGHLSAEGLPETPWGGPFEHYIQSKCHLQPRCKTLMIWP